MATIVLLAAELAPHRLTGQDTSALSATLLRRVAEAVDAQRNDRPVWVVVQSRFPYHVRGVYDNPAKAAASARLAPGYRRLGPFRTQPDSGLMTVMYTMDPCPGLHDPFSECPDTTHPSSVAAIAQESVDSIVVTIYGRGTRIRRRFAATEVDALFFTLPAIDKFVLPYYTRLYGPGVAARMRADYLGQVRRSLR